MCLKRVSATLAGVEEVGGPPKGWAASTLGAIDGEKRPFEYERSEDLSRVPELGRGE